MGGGLSLAFPTRNQRNFNFSAGGTTSTFDALIKEVGLKGVLVSAPLLRQTKRTGALLLKIGGLLGKLNGSMKVKTEVDPKVGFSLLSPSLSQLPRVFFSHYNIDIDTNVFLSDQYVTRDPVLGAEYASDPLCAPVGTYRGVSDMLNGGELLMKRDWKNWPKGLPVLVIHGSGDFVSSFPSLQEA